MTKELLRLVRSDDLKGVENMLTDSPELVESVMLRRSLLGHAAMRDNIPMMELLVSKGHDIDAGFSKCETPLTSAISEEKIKAVRWLLDRGANPNGKKDDARPISEAILSNLPGVVRWLLEIGARLDISWGHFEYTPFTFAESFGDSHREILETLRGHDSTPSSQTAIKTDEPKTDVRSFLEKHYGLSESLSARHIISNFDIAVNVVSTEAPYPYKLLMTDGISNSKLPKHDIQTAYEKIELAMLLPDAWSTEDLMSDDPKLNWLITWLLTLGNQILSQQLPMVESFTVFSNGDPAEPLFPGTKMSAFLAGTELISINSFTDKEGDPVQVFTITPIYAEERDYFVEHGPHKLFDVFSKKQVPILVDNERPNSL